MKVYAFVNERSAQNLQVLILKKEVLPYERKKPSCASSKNFRLYSNTVFNKKQLSGLFC